MRIPTVMFLFIVNILIYPSTAPAEEINKEYHESFQVQEGMTLHLSHGDGDVTIIPWENDVLDVKVHYAADVYSKGIGSKRDFKVEFRQAGNDIYVTEKERSSILIGVHSVKHIEYTYTIQAPPYLRLNLRGDDGDVVVDGWQGEIKSRLDDGNIDFRDIVNRATDIDIEDGNVRIGNLEGELEINSDDGNVTLENCKMPRCIIDLEDGPVRITDCEGEFEIASDDGDIYARNLRAPALEVRTADGTVDLDLLNVSAIDAFIQSDDGDISLSLEEGMSAEINIRKDDGRLRTDLHAFEFIEQDSHRITGRLEGGNGRIRIDTDDGDITLREK